MFREPKIRLGPLEITGSAAIIALFIAAGLFVWLVIYLEVPPLGLHSIDDLSEPRTLSDGPRDLL